MKNNSFKKFYISVSSIFICILHIPFVFAKSKSAEWLHKSAGNKLETLTAAPASTLFVPGTNLLAGMYDSLKLNIMGLSQQAFLYGMQGFDYLYKAGKFSNNKIISIADFSLPSYKKRLFIIDLEKMKVLFNTYVAHGMNSGKEYAKTFSNIPESNQTSLGFYQTTDTYMGCNGYSLHLEGLEKGINDKANSRAIVMHGADYVSESFIQSQGYIGRSWGCPAVPEKLHKPIINKIKNGTCLFIYSPDKSYRIHSRILKEATAMAYNNKN